MFMYPCNFWFAGLATPTYAPLSPPPPGDLGPIASALKAVQFDELHLISDHPRQDSQSYIAWLNTLSSTRILLHEASLSSPTHYEEIYRAADGVLAGLGNGARDQLSFHLSPGTPAMAAVWIILAKTKYPAQLIESSREHRGSTVNPITN